jgi:hypothetical protein
LSANELCSSDPYWAEIGNLARDKLADRFAWLTGQAREVNQAWQKPMS